MSPSMAPASLPPVQTPAPTVSAQGAGTAPAATDPAAATAAVDPTAAATGPPGSSTGPPGNGSPPTDAFASVLSDQVARTALAEGQKGSAPKTSERKSDKDAAADTPAAAGATATAAPGSDAAAVQAQALVAAQAAAPAQAAQTPAGAQAGGTTADAQNTGAQATASAVAGTADAGSVLTTIANTAATAKAAPATGRATGEDTTASPAPATTASTSPVAPHGVPATDGHTPKDSDARQDATDQQSAPAGQIALPGVAKAAGRETAKSASPAKASAGAQSAQAGAGHVVAKANAAMSTAPTETLSGQAGAPATPSLSAARPLTSTPAAAYGVRLEQAAETVRTTIAMAARQGASSARIQLAPEALGGLQIHLQKTPDGLVARVIADHAAAAQTLAQNGDDLRRSLESHGMTLLRLDIESGDRRDPSAQGRDDTGGSSAGPRSGADEDLTVDGTPATTSTQTTTHDLSGTALVNVLA